MQRNTRRKIYHKVKRREEKLKMTGMNGINYKKRKICIKS